MSGPETFIVGDREFTCHPMPPFVGNAILLRLQKVLLPALGAAFSTGGKGLADMDVTEAARLLSENVDEGTMTSIVLPMFEASRVYDVTKKKFIKSATDIDVCFTMETLADLYELIWLVGRHQFAPFFGSVLSRFGNAMAAPPETPSPQ